MSEFKMKTVETIPRLKCAITGLADLEHLHTIPTFPVFMGCVDHPKEQDLFADMSWNISRSSGLIQLANLIPLDVLYSEQHSSGVVGELWIEHHREFAHFIDAYKPDVVFEIGGAHGILAHEYSKIRTVPWTILEPNPAPINENAACFVKGYFGDSTRIPLNTDTVIHSHVLEHIYDPVAFWSQLEQQLLNGSRVIFSVPNLEKMLEKGYTNAINFEHSIYLTEPYVDYLLNLSNFQILKKAYFKIDHSCFYAVEKVFQTKKTQLPPGLYARNKNVYESLVRTHNDLISKLNYMMTGETRKIFLFGAHVFSQFLITFGLDISLVDSILDNDIKKQGRRLYGTDFIIKSPAILRNEVDPIVILRAGVYNNEIKRQILENVNPLTEFLE